MSMQIKKGLSFFVINYEKYFNMYYAYKIYIAKTPYLVVGFHKWMETRNNNFKIQWSEYKKMFFILHNEHSIMEN